MTVCIFTMTVCPHTYSVTFTITLWAFHNHLCTLTVTLYVLSMTHSALTVCINFTMNVSSQFVCPHESLCFHRASVWPSQWLVRPSEWLHALLTMTLCDLYNDIMCPHNDFCALMTTLCAYTRTLCISQWLCVTLMMPLFPQMNCVIITLCHAHAFCMTLTMTLCEMNSDALMLTMILCILTMTMCNFTMSVCPYNDSVIHKITLCPLSKTLCYLYNGFVHHYNGNVWYSQWLCMTFTMSFCDFMIYVPSKWGCVPS